jgi:superfamily II DNA or RNA helicase/HKD family nuclease
MPLPDGLYDKLVTDSLARALADLPSEECRTLAALPPEEATERIANALAKQMTQLLDELDGDAEDKAKRQLALVNELLVHLRTQVSAASVDPLVQPPHVLRAVHSGGCPPEIPETGLAIPWLFTAGKGSPSLLAELRREMAGCDQVDLLVSFITVSGVRKLFDILQTATAADAAGCPRTRLRILTTTYTGATEVEALDYFARLPGCQIRVSLDGRRTRLHAKAWIFHRRTGFGSAYVGSANLSGAALLGGLEWTVKFTEQGQLGLFSRAKAHFETLWNDGEFQHYDASKPEHRSELSRALKREAGDQIPATTSFFDLDPKDYQKEMLEQLALEREHGRLRNLIVAATGTGKTVVAAFDYRASCRAIGGRPRLLFVAHRKEILLQARRTYREVLRDHSFGEILGDGLEPQHHEHLFAVIDSVCSRALVGRFGPRYWHTVVVDECHRLAADRFDSFVKSVQPQILLGLTATPERSDGQPIYPYFDNRPDGSPAVELRLWHALDLQLLSPFEYYGCDDDTDFSSVPWDRPGEREAIDKLVTGNDVRARLVVNEWRRLTGDPKRTRTLVFCVSVAHAEFMAQKLTDAGFPALCVIGSTDMDTRREAPQRLARGELCALVTCDLYNEGVDLPSVDTLLLLRPTQSPVLFQQQIGRGLRLHEGKQSCLVLDFVGRYRAEFRFDRLLSALTGLSRGQMTEAVEKGFSQLPAGCHIQLQQFTKEQILRSLRTAVNQSRRRLRGELQSYVALRGRTDIRLADFLHEQALQPEELYRAQGNSGWTALKREAGLLCAPPATEDDYLSRRFADLLHIDDPEQTELMLRVSQPTLSYGSLGDRERRRLQILAYQIDGQHHQTGSGEQFLDRLAGASELRSELGELAAVLQARSNLRFRPIPGLEEIPLCLHASYGIREILTAVGWLTSEKRTPFQAGVLALQDRKIELLFVTLDKSEGFHDAIAYHDYAVSADRFAWQSQNSAGPKTTAGQRYLNSPGNGWSFQLFVRSTQGNPYRACGPVFLDKAEGEKPMSIEWRMGVPLPARLFQEFSVLRGQ